MIKRTTFLFFSLVLFINLFQGCETTGDLEEKMEEPKGGLRFTSEFHNFGEVIMGDHLEAKFPFKNVTENPLKITDLITTCGCTVAELKKFNYASGEEGVIKVLLDTTLKKGLVTKTITVKTNDPERKEIHLALTARVKMPPHPDEKSVVRIMGEECRLCHIEAGKGLEEGYLYHKVCWQCHGDPIHPPTSINLFNKEFLKRRTDEDLYKSITKGDAVNGMPAYLDKENGRGLTEQQIQSLVKFIRSHEERD